MSEEKKQETARLKKHKETLLKSFDEQPDEIIIFEPKEEGEFVLGRIVDNGISKEFKTPFLVLTNKEGEEITVFIKMGIVPKFQRKKWITIEDSWNEEIVSSNIGNLIAFQYIGKAVSERTKREFEKYKVLFPTDLDKEGITDFP